MPTEFDPCGLPDDVSAFLAERHLATLTTLRRSGAPQVTPVGFTYEPSEHCVRVITWATSFKAKRLSANAESQVAVCQLDGRRWLTFYGAASVSDDPERVGEAVRRYAQRYRQPKKRDDRVVIEVNVDRIIGNV